MSFNIVELAASCEGDETAFDQPCKFGHRVDDHAVYCHNNNWEDSPRKCRRTWFTGGEIKDEDCPGFEANPLFTAQLCPTTQTAPLCSICNGKRRVSVTEDMINST